MGRVKIYNSLEEAKEAKKASDKERRRRNSEKIKEWDDFEKYGLIKQMRYAVEQMKKEEETKTNSDVKEKTPNEGLKLDSDEEHS